MDEEDIPLDRVGKPVFAAYTRPIGDYIQMHEGALTVFDRGEDADPNDAKRAYPKRVHGEWGLIAQGEAALPKALELLRRSSPYARAGGAGILSGLMRHRSLASRAEWVDPVLGAAAMSAASVADMARDEYTWKADLESLDSLVTVLADLGD